LGATPLIVIIVDASLVVFVVELFEAGELSDRQSKRLADVASVEVIYSRDI